jgi:ribose-phosphate pyrophosphokinase
LLDRGALEVYSCCTHPVFSGKALERLSKSPVKEVVVTDTLPLNGSRKLDKITVLDTSSLFGEAIMRIHTGKSIGDINRIHYV